MKWLAAVLVLLIGLLNFHIPHFLLEGPAASSRIGLELVFLANVAAALASAIAVAADWRWGWLLGVTVVAVSFALYVTQETIGLPGLPQNWLEPSRIVAVAIEVGFVVVAGLHFRSPAGSH